MINKLKQEIFNFFPYFFDIEKETFWKEKIQMAEEVRVRVGQPICIRGGKNETFFGEKIKIETIQRILENFSNNSIYSVQNEINSGFLTIKGGHRIGIVGTCIFENNTIKNIKNISSLNIRVAREIKKCSQEILKHIINNRKFENTLILSPPGCGKTTLLRDMIRELSDGSEICEPYQVGVVDERSEIGAIYHGVPQNELGKRTDIMNQCKKEIGMRMLIRSMGPQVIATDEIRRCKRRRSYFKSGLFWGEIIINSTWRRNKRHINNITRNKDF